MWAKTDVAHTGGAARRQTCLESDTQTLPSVTVGSNQAVCMERITDDPMPQGVDDIVELEVLEDIFEAIQPVPQKRSQGRIEEQIVDVTVPLMEEIEKASQVVP